MTPFRLVKEIIKRESPISTPRRLFNFFYWQLIRRWSSSPFRFTLPDGARMTLKAGEAGASGFYYYGYPDLEEMLFLRKYLRPDDLFVDIGANSGGWSLTAFGLGAKAIAVEPVRSTFERLTRNFSLNSTDRLSALCLGVSDAEGELFFTTDADTGNKVAAERTPDGKTEKANVVTLDSLLKGKSPSFIKIDVEGHELPVILGAANTLKNERLRALIIETFRWANYKMEQFQAIETILLRNGFLPVAYHPVTDELVKLKPGEGGQNTIYVKQGWLNIRE